MKKTFSKILSLLLALTFVLSFTALAFAEPSKPYVYDEMNVFTPEEKAELNAKLKEIREKYDFDVVILTVESLGEKSAAQYADDYFDYNGFGTNDSHDGVLFMISAYPREWAISTCGYGIEAFTPVGQEYIMDRVLPHLKNDEYYEAFSEFANLSDSFIEEALTDEPYDNGHMPPKPLTTYLIWALFSIAAGFIIAIIIAQIMKSKLKSVRPQTQANDYLKRDTVHLTRQDDILVNKFVTFEIIERDNDSSSGRSSGSDIHTSSSGRSHGGSSGSY